MSGKIVACSIAAARGSAAYRPLPDRDVPASCRRPGARQAGKRHSEWEMIGITDTGAIEWDMQADATTGTILKNGPD